jgi:hypothetical protein
VASCSIRDGTVVRPWGTQPEAIEEQLDSHASLVAEAEDPDMVRQSVAAVWELQLQALLRQHPETEDEMRVGAELAIHGGDLRRL